MSTPVFVSLSYWAVGRHAETSQVAIKLNDGPPILMSVDSARELAAALMSETDAVAPPYPLRRAATKKK